MNDQKNNTIAIKACLMAFIVLAMLMVSACGSTASTLGPDTGDENGNDNGDENGNGGPGGASPPSLPSGVNLVTGLVPDWNQPYYYESTASNGGPGPGTANVADDFDAWCSPTSASNLLGHWRDTHSKTVSDSAAFPNSEKTYGQDASWQDYLLDGRANRLDSSLSIHDIAVYMDTNGLNENTSTLQYLGTRIKMIRLGLNNFLASSNVTTTVCHHYAPGYNTFTVSNCTNPSTFILIGQAFTRLKTEIDANRTVLIAFNRWNVSPTQNTVINAPWGDKKEAEDYPLYAYTLGDVAFGTSSLSTASQTTSDLNLQADVYIDGLPIEEVWNLANDGSAIGHTVTAIGYIEKNSALWPTASTLKNYDWVIVHDNVPSSNSSGTPRNIAVPFIEGPIQALITVEIQ